MIRPIGTSRIKGAETTSTILDNDNHKRISIDIEKCIPGGVKVGEGTTVRTVRLPKALRAHLRRNMHDDLVLTPVVRAFDQLVAAVLSGNGPSVRQSTVNFFHTRCREMQREFVKVAKVRNDRSAMLVGMCGYRHDIFCGDNYASGKLCDLKPWQVGLNSETIKKLAVDYGEIVVFSRYPTTMVIPTEVVETDLPGNVVSLPVYDCILHGRTTSAAHETGGDKDGDLYTIRTVHTEAAESELRDVFHKFWHGVPEVELDRTCHTWRDHEPKHSDPWQVAHQKVMQKTAVGSITLDWYAVFTAFLDAGRSGRETDLTFEDVRQLMMQSLESVFDLKHNNGASPMTLHALLLGMITFTQAEAALAKQGIDVEKLRKVIELVGGGSVRDAAMGNAAYAIAYGHPEKGFNPVERFSKRVGADTPLAQAYRDEILPERKGAVR